MIYQNEDMTEAAEALIEPSAEASELSLTVGQLELVLVKKAETKTLIKKLPKLTEKIANQSYAMKKSLALNINQRNRQNAVYSLVLTLSAMPRRSQPQLLQSEKLPYKGK